MPPKKAEKAAAPQKSEEELRLGKELAEKEVAVVTLSEAVKRHLENEARLTQEAQDLEKQLKACQKDLFDINEFLLNELKVQALITAELEQNLREAGHQAEQTSISHKAELKEAQQQSRQEREELEEQLRQLQAQAGDAAAHLKNKANLTSQLKKVAAAREAERAAANKRISQLERQGLEDMDKAQADLAAKLAEVRQEATAAAGGEALIRNRELEQELAEQSLQLEKLLSKGTELGRENAGLRRKLAAVEELHDSLARRCHACQKAVQTLVVEKQGWAQEQERGEADLAAARGEIQELQQQVADCGVAAEEQASLLESHKEETESLRERVLQMEERSDEALLILKRLDPSHPSPGLWEELRDQLHILLAGTAWKGAAQGSKGVMLPPVPFLKLSSRKLQTPQVC